MIVTEQSEYIGEVIESGEWQVARLAHHRDKLVALGQAWSRRLEELSLVRAVLGSGDYFIGVDIGTDIGTEKRL